MSAKKNVRQKWRVLVTKSSFLSLRIHENHLRDRATALSQSEEISSDFCCFYGGGIRHNEDIMHSFQHFIVRLIPSHPPPLETRIWKLVVRALPSEEINTGSVVLGKKRPQSLLSYITTADKGQSAMLMNGPFVASEMLRNVAKRQRRNSEGSSLVNGSSEQVRWPGMS